MRRLSLTTHMLRPLSTVGSSRTRLTNLALNSDSDWRPFKIEAYLFIAAIYFAFCFSMSRYSLWIEKRLSTSKNR